MPSPINAIPLLLSSSSALPFHCISSYTMLFRIISGQLGAIRFQIFATLLPIYSARFCSILLDSIPDLLCSALFASSHFLLGAVQFQIFASPLPI